MSFETIVFYIFAAITLLSGVKVVTSRDPVQAVLFLVLTFISTAGIWMLAQAEFLALTLILVYVGAVMVLFLFVVMMLDINMEKIREGLYKWLWFGALLAGLMAIEMVLVLGDPSVSVGKIAAEHGADYSNTKELGRLIYTDFVYPFEIAAVLLLVAMVAAIALTLRERTDSKHQNISKQVAVTKGERLRVVSMKSVAKQSVASDETH